jgi:L-lactate dehydrogenase (cytochrome)
VLASRRATQACDRGACTAEITSIENLRTLARKRVLRTFYDYVDGGLWSEYTYQANEADFQRIELRPAIGCRSP